MNATDFAKHVKGQLEGLPNEPKIQPRGQIGNGLVEFKFPNGLRIQVWENWENEDGEELAFEIFLRNFPKDTYQTFSFFKMTEDRKSVGDASVDEMTGRLIEAASHTNPAGLLPSKDRDALAQAGRDKIQQDTDLNRWEKLSLAYTLTNNILP